MKPPTYKTNKFILKPYKKSDEERFIEIGTDKDVVEFMSGSDGSKESERKLFQHIFKLYNKKENDRFFWIWGIYEKAKLIGHFELKETEHTNHNELEIVYMVHPDERKRGVMSEVLEFFKANQNLWNKKIIATVNPQNISSISLLERWGIERKETIKDLETNEKYFKVWLK